MKNFCLVLTLALSVVHAANAGDGEGRSRYAGEFEADKPWQEAATDLPAAPTPANLREIYVSAVATNNYFVDEATLTVGNDRVVRYVLVVEASGGARNVSFEGMHCDSGKWKLYATGRADGTWTRARVSEWRDIENKPVNRHHAALSRDYFCPNGGPISDANEGRRALNITKRSKSN
ncbi:MAG: CNP1-like family protein [Rhodocyclaceae bacterium]|nr:CNP1-like family protein [Rhodocyclaceae bacterium]